MASDDGRAQVQLDEDTLARRRRDLGEDHFDTMISARGHHWSAGPAGRGGGFAVLTLRGLEPHLVTEAFHVRMPRQGSRSQPSG